MQVFNEHARKVLNKVEIQALLVEAPVGGIFAKQP